MLGIEFRDAGGAVIRDPDGGRAAVIGDAVRGGSDRIGADDGPGARIDFRDGVGARIRDPDGGSAAVIGDAVRAGSDRIGTNRVVAGHHNHPRNAVATPKIMPRPAKAARRSGGAGETRRSDLHFPRDRERRGGCRGSDADVAGEITRLRGGAVNGVVGSAGRGFRRSRVEIDAIALSKVP